MDVLTRLAIHLAKNPHDVELAMLRVRQESIEMMMAEKRRSKRIVIAA